MRAPMLMLASMIALLAAACGGGGSPATSPGNPPPPTSSTAPDTASPKLTVPFVAPEAALTFYVFGAKLPSGLLNPTWEIETASPTTPVVAAAAGKVVTVNLSSQADSTLVVLPSDQSVYAIVYDHVSAVRVAAGQTVTAGTQLGSVGRLANGRGRTELQVNRKVPAPTVALCPRAFFTAAITEQFQAAAQRVNGSPTICLAETVAP